MPGLPSVIATAIRAGVPTAYFARVHSRFYNVGAYLTWPVVARSAIAGSAITGSFFVEALWIGLACFGRPDGPGVRSSAAYTHS